MATIFLYASKINQMSSLTNEIKKSVIDLKSELLGLKNKSLQINRSICNLEEVIDSISASTRTQEQMVDSLESFQKNTEQFIADAARIDSEVADIINQRKNDFYNTYRFLKPDSEKEWLEKHWDDCKNYLKKAGDWCKEHWKLALKIVVVLLLVTVSAVLLCTGVGGILAAMAWGAIIGAGIGGFTGAIMSAWRGGSILEGFVNGAFGGAIGGAIGGGVTFWLTSLLGPASTLLGSIAQGAGIGAVSGGISNMAVTAISIFLQNGTLNGALGTILFSGFAGSLAGGLVGGILGGLKFARLQRTVELSKKAAADKAAELRAGPSKDRPYGISAAVNSKTGEISYGANGYGVPDNIHPELLDRLPTEEMIKEMKQNGIPLPKWKPGECAEFQAANEALWKGAKLEDLVITTVKVKTGEAFEMCFWCKIIFKGILVTSQ